MTFLRKLAFLAIIILANYANVAAQCTNWNNLPNKEEVENAHVVYRQYLKDKTVADLQALKEGDFQLAFDSWQKAYTNAPAADGGRPSHYIDGILLYQTMIAKTEDATKKAEYGQVVVKLYDEYLTCYPGDSKLILGRKAFDMFYSHAYGYQPATLDAIKKAMDAAGNDTEYILLDPLGKLLVYLYESEQIGKEVVQQMYQQATGIAEHNINNGHPYKAYYESGKANMDADVAKIANEVFDCSYFKKDLLPKFAQNKRDWAVVGYIRAKLLQQGCEETDADLAELNLNYEELQDSIRRLNPCFNGLRLQQDGKYTEALENYQRCVDSEETDNDTKATIYYSMASIQVWQLGQLGAGEANARRALELRPGWGKPHILLGDIMAKRSSGCDDWNRRLACIAIIDRYSRARGDAESADDASSRIARYSGSLPSKDEAFMRGISAGQSVSVGCIGETVSVRFRD